MEVHKAPWFLRKDKALGLDSFPLFFCYYWPIIAGEVTETMQVVFYLDGIPVEWKKILIILIPKRYDAFLRVTLDRLACAPPSTKYVLGF